MNPYFIPYVLTSVLVLVLSSYAVQRREIAGAGWYALVAAIQGSLQLLYIFELSSLSLDQKLFWDNAQWLPLLAFAWAMSGFAFSFSGQMQKLKRLLLLVGLPALVFALLVIIGGDRRLLHANPRIESSFPFDVLLYEFTPLAWALFVYVVATAFFANLVLAVQTFRTRGALRTRLVIVLIGFFIPTLMGSLFYLLDIRVMGQRDAAPLSLALSNLVIAYAIFRHRLFSITSIARDIVIESLQDAVVVVDAENRLVDLNPAARLALDPTIGDPIGQPNEIAFPQWKQMAVLFKQTVSTHQEVSAVMGGKEIFVDLIISPIYDQHKQLVGRVMVARDVTERKIVEQARRQAEAEQFAAQLEQERMRLVTTFIKDTMHEFRTPLSSILTGLHLMQRSDQTEYRSGKSAQIESSVWDIITMLDRTAEMIRLNEGESALRLEKIDLVMMLSDCLTELEPAVIRRGVKVVFEPISEPVHIWGDFQLLYTAFRNIIDNAIKYTYKGGTVTVGIRIVNVDAVMVRIADTGMGMSDEVQKHIFETFYRADEARSVTGLGLGLGLAQKIISLHKGQISLSSEVNVGSEFAILLPLSYRAG